MTRAGTSFFNTTKPQHILILIQIAMDVNPTIELTHANDSAHKIVLAFPILKTSAKFVQTSAEVSRKYYVLNNLSARTQLNKYAH